MESHTQKPWPLEPIPQRTRYIVCSLLLISCSLNVAALYLPFMKLRKGVFTEAYSLPHSVTLLWEKDLYILSVLVVAFSILFPFAKLAVLAWVSFFGALSQRKATCLQRVERFGKWSMLDVFLVSIILSLASNQFLLSAKPQLGLSCFIVAVLLSMLSGELLVRRLPEEQRPSEPLTDRSGSGLLLILLFSGSLFAALLFPFLQIQDWLLADRAYSIVTLVPALWKQGAWLAAILTAVFLVAAPLVAWSTHLIAWIRLRRRKGPPLANRWLELAARWSMLDVFGLALIIFALESDHLMSTRIRWGALFLGAALLLRAFVSQALERNQAKRSNSRGAQD